MRRPVWGCGKPLIHRTAATNSTDHCRGRGDSDHETQPLPGRAVPVSGCPLLTGTVLPVHNPGCRVTPTSHHSFKFPIIIKWSPRPPKGIDPSSLPDLAHYKGHGIDRVTAWCLTPLCHHQRTLSFGELEGVRRSRHDEAMGFAAAAEMHEMRPTECGSATGLVAASEMIQLKQFVRNNVKPS
jgi:hypothetical protein